MIKLEYNKERKGFGYNYNHHKRGIIWGTIDLYSNFVFIIRKNIMLDNITWILYQKKDIEYSNIKGE